MLAILAVTSLADNLTVDGQLTLREAIRAAELDISVDGSLAGSGTDTIEFHPSLSGALHLSTVGDTSAGASAFLVSTPIIIRGNASGITITRSIVAAEMRFFHVATTGDLTLESLTFAAGVARGANGVPGDPNGGDGRGGAILSEGTLQLIGSTVYGNQAHGGTAVIGGSPGAGRGGAVFSEGGFVHIRNTTISGNAARNSDGVSINQAFGGGVFSRNSLLTIDLSTIVDNTATAGRGVYVIGEGTGKTSSLELNNSIVGNNGPIEEFTDVVVTYDNGGASSSTGDSNLIRKEVAFDGSIVSNGAPQLGPLADNGGPTWTHAILPGSPALDAGNVSMILGQAGVPPTDQRGVGFARVVNGDGLLGSRVDIGAYELQADSSVTRLPGDYNLNGVVDVADYTLWRDQLNHPVAAFTGPDGDGSGFVDAADYNVWKANFGATAAALASTAAASSVQEREVALSTQLDEASLFGASWNLVRFNEAARNLGLPSNRSSTSLKAPPSATDHGGADLLNLLALENVAGRNFQSIVITRAIDQSGDGSPSNHVDKHELAELWDDWQRAEILLTF